MITAPLVLAVAVALLTGPQALPAHNASLSSHSAAAAGSACPGPDPKHCNCAYTHGGRSCPKARDDGSECFCRCCCQFKAAGFVCKWHDPHPSPPPAPPTPAPPAPAPPAPPAPAPPPGPPGQQLTAVKVQHNRLVDAAGNLVVLRGVSHSGSEYTCLHAHGGEGHGGGSVVVKGVGGVQRK